MAFMVLSIVFAIFLWLPLTVISVGGMIADSIYSKTEILSDAESITECMTNLDFTHDAHSGYANCPNKPAAASNMIMAFFSGALILLLILSASFACCAVCRCCGAEQENTVQPWGQQPNQQQQYNNQAGYYTS